MVARSQTRARVCNSLKSKDWVSGGWQSAGIHLLTEYLEQLTQSLMGILRFVSTSMSSLFFLPLYAEAQISAGRDICSVSEEVQVECDGCGLYFLLYQTAPADYGGE